VAAWTKVMNLDRFDFAWFPLGVRHLWGFKTPCISKEGGLQWATFFYSLIW
jgi:hypothetical protein